MNAKILGTIRICRGNEVLNAQQLGGPKSRQILEILLMHLGTPVSKGKLVDLLWDGAAPAAAVSTLESYVSVLRRCLQPGQGKSGVLKTTTGGYLLEQEMIDLDLARFSELLARAEHSGAKQAYALLQEALHMANEPLLGNELLPEWAENERRMHAARVAAAGVHAAEAALELGLASEAVRWAQRVLDGDALNEPAWTCMILGLEQGRNPVQGLQAFERCRRVMDREMGCQPGPVLQSAQARMLLDTSAENDDFGQVIRALLAIQGSLMGKSQLARPSEAHSAAELEFTVQEAGTIVAGYVQRALVQVVA
ncbi:AfsR/SARP family transcriptional regulator [Paeniglutamicibacter kerguelensis]